MSTIQAPTCPANPSVEIYLHYAKLYKEYLKVSKTINPSKDRLEVSPLNLHGGGENKKPESEPKLKPQVKPSAKSKRCTLCKTTFNSRNSLFRHLPACRANQVHSRNLTSAKNQQRIKLMQKHKLSNTDSFEALKTTEFFEQLKTKPLPNTLVKGLRQHQLEYSESDSRQTVVHSLENVTGIPSGGTFFTNSKDTDDLVEFMKDCPIYDTQTEEGLELTLSDDIEPQDLRTIYRRHAQQQLAREVSNTSLHLSSMNLNANQGNVNETFEFYSEAQVHAALGVEQTPDSKMASTFGINTDLSNSPKDQLSESLPKPRIASRTLYEFLQADEDEEDDDDHWQHPAFAGQSSGSGQARRESIFSRSGDNELFDSE